MRQQDPQHNNTNQGWAMAPNVSLLQAIVENVERVIIGKREAVELAVIALACRGHVLIEDVPGIGKTSLVHSIARSLDCSFKRIQFTPDILPSDITGFSMFNQKTGEFEFRPGAIMAQVVLADEINRTSPKTQSSLLEVMEEGQVTVDGHSFVLPEPFIVFATQNPVEYLGTYPLPEAQLDRFFLKISLGYPKAADEMRLLERFRSHNPLESLSSVATSEQLLDLQEQVHQVYIDDSVNEYIVSLVRRTRAGANILLGASPRATLCLARAAQAWALCSGRDYVLPDDVIRMAVPVLEHRLVLKQEAKLRKLSPASLVRSIIEDTPVPV